MEETIEGLKADNQSLAAELMATKAILGGMIDALHGQEPSDFMRSFFEVEHAWMVFRLAYPTVKP